MIDDILAELRRRLHEQYELIAEQIRIQDWSLTCYQIQNVDDLMEQLIARGEEDPAYRDEQIPYWAELWASAVGLGRYLARRKMVLPGQKVLELGCGLGLPGMVARKMGAEVTLSDYLPEPLEMARLNWLENFGEEPRLSLLDWRQPDPDLAAEVVLASDVAYETRAFEPLLDAFQILVKPGGKLLLSEPNRTLAKPFLEAVRQLGYSVEEDLVQVRHRGFLTPITIFCMRLPAH